jgi:hypothetical protein
LIHPTNPIPLANGGRESFLGEILCRRPVPAQYRSETDDSAVFPTKERLKVFQGSDQWDIARSIVVIAQVWPDCDIIHTNVNRNRRGCRGTSII